MARRLSAVASTGALKDLRPIPANDVAKGATGKTDKNRRSGKTHDVELLPLTPPVSLRPTPRAPVVKIIGNVARRTAHIAMDALVIVVFAPIIAAWVLIERRRRRTPQV